MAAERLEIRPESHGEAGGVGRAETCGLRNAGPHHGDAKDVGLELHEQTVGGHATVDFEDIEQAARIGGHGVDHVARLPGHRLQGGAGDVSARDVGGQADDDAACVGAPVGGEQTGEGRHQGAAAVVGDAGGQGLDLGRGGEEAQIVAQPLDQRAGDGDRAFQGVDGRGLADAVAEGGEQAMVRSDRSLAGVDQQEVAGAIGALALAWREAGLAEQGGLLVAER